MATVRTDKVTQADAAAGEQGPAQFSEQDKNKARKWFERAQAVADSRNYDYAIECYINGLALWPDAVEDGHQRLLAVAMARRAAGMRKAGLVEAFKRSMNTRDPRQGMLNAEFLLSKDPGNPSYMEGMLRNANKARLDRTIRWLGRLFLEAIARQKKPSVSRLRLAQEVFEQAGDRAGVASDYEAAIELYQFGVQALELLQQLRPDDLQVTNKLRDLSSKLAIVKGNYEKARDFRESLRDAEAQKALHDEERLVQSAEGLGRLIERAREELSNQPRDPTRIMHLADLLCRREDKKQEDEAIELLMEAYAQQKSYRFKYRADDIRLRQLRREARDLVAKSKQDPENGLLRQRAAELAQTIRQLELDIFRERAENYPTDLSIRFEYGLRLFQAGLFDQAIPVLQAGRFDPRHRIPCQLYLGRCFFAKGYYRQAIDVLRQAIGEHEVAGDALAKELHYWLGRSYEENGDAEQALDVYGKIIQWDYNYQDVRERMDRLRG
ncbi:MAG: hypothetical protein ACE5K7_02195 [Phycisphaerae bacterium]